MTEDISLILTEKEIAPSQCHYGCPVGIFKLSDHKRSSAMPYSVLHRINSFIYISNGLKVSKWEGHPFEKSFSLSKDKAKSA